MIKKILIFLILISITGVSTKAQDFELDTTFNADYNFYNWSSYYHPIVYNLLESPNNELYVSGRCYDATSDNFHTLLRFDSFGNYDNLFMPINGFNSRIFDFKIQDGLICSLGRKGTNYSDFHTYDESGNIMNDSWSQIFHNAFYYHASLNGKLYENGKALYVGDFNLVSSSINYDIVRINVDGSPDTSLMADVFSGGSDVIWEIEPYTEDKLLVFGRWGSWLGDNSVEDGLRRILLPSCTIDTSFQNVLESVLDSAFYPWLNDIIVLEDGKIIITGKFKLKGIEYAQGIARLNSDGSLDNTFNNANNLSDFLTPIRAINTISLLHDSTGYLIGGFFESYQGLERHCIVKTDLDGFIDPNSLIGLGIDTISYITGSGPTDWSWGVTQILPTENEKYYIGGQIDGFNGVTTQPVFRIQPTPYSVIDESINSKLKIYPNPGTGKFVLTGSDLHLVRIFNITGSLIKEIEPNNSSMIDFSLIGQTRGVYFIEITNAGKKFTRLLILM